MQRFLYGWWFDRSYHQQTSAIMDSVKMNIQGDTYGKTATYTVGQQHVQYYPSW